MLQALDRALRADRHEGRHLDRAVRRRERRPPRRAGGVDVVDGKREGLGHEGRPLRNAKK